MNVLVTGAGAVLGQAIIKSLRKISSIEIRIVSVDPNPDAAGFLLSDSYSIIPFAKSENYIEELIKVSISHKVDFIFVGTDIELPKLSANKSIIEQASNAILIVSDPWIISMADDKFKTYEFLKSHDFYHPLTELYESYDYQKSLIKPPFIIKPRIGARSIGVSLVDSIEQLIKKAPELEQPIIQEYLSSSEEYTAGVIYFDDENIASIVMKRTLKDGNTFTALPMEYSWMNTYLENITKNIKPFGPINYQFKIDENTIKIFEINARFSGTTHFRALSNFNEVKMVVDFLKFSKRIQQPKINISIKILRYYDELIKEI
jgi:carbamoyl-phosphate synthase large subunit